MCEIRYSRQAIGDIRILVVSIRKMSENSLEGIMGNTYFYQEIEQLEHYVDALQKHESQLTALLSLEDGQRETVERTKKSFGIESQTKYEDPYDNPYMR